MPRDRRPYLILPLAALIAVLPLIVRGCSCGHDFDFHIISWFEAARQFTHGTLHPHWAYTPAWNAGEPRFVFYPPLSWTIGALLGLVMPHAFGGWAWTPIVYTWLALTAAGLALHHAARSFATPNAALLAAAIYIANPYTLYTAYERSAYAELLAAAWIPLLLHAILRDRVTIPGIAIPVALLWLTNAPAAVMGCYALALLATFRLILATNPGAPFMQSHRMSGTSRASATTTPPAKLALNTTLGTLLGLGLAAFYIIPAAYERRFVQIAFAILPGLRPQDNFLFHHTIDPEHDAVLHTASIVAALLIALTAVALLINMRTNEGGASSSSENEPGAPSSPRLLRLRWASRESATTAACLTILAFVIALMLTPLSTMLWAHLPEHRFQQFPWRLIAILAAVFALALAIALSRLSLSPIQATVAALLAAGAFTIPAWHSFHQRCYPEDTLPERLAIFRSANPGTDPTDEYTPTTADNDALANANPGYWLASDETAPSPKDTPPAPAPHHLDITATAPQILILNLRDYPAWRINLNGAPIAERLHRDDGLIAIPLPAGPAHIDIAYITLPDQRIGYGISALSALCLIVITLRRKPAVTLASATQPPR
jgi:hypothetical protein